MYWSKTTSCQTFLLLDEGREEVSGVGVELMVVEGIDDWRDKDETLSTDVGGVGVAVFDVRHGMWTLYSGT